MAYLEIMEERAVDRKGAPRLENPEGIRPRSHDPALGRDRIVGGPLAQCVKTGMPDLDEGG